MSAHSSAGSFGTSATPPPPRSVVEVGGVEEVVVAEAEDTAKLLPRAARAVSNAVMFIVSPDPS